MGEFDQSAAAEFLCRHALSASTIAANSWAYTRATINLATALLWNFAASDDDRSMLVEAKDMLRAIQKRKDFRRANQATKTNVTHLIKSAEAGIAGKHKDDNGKINY